jgi:hypothetical protein
MQASERQEAAPWAALGLLPVFALTTSLGLLIVALADDGARSGAGYADPLFWTGLAVMVAPAAARLFAKSPSRGERLGIVIAIGLAAYLVKVLHSPIQFTFHDELGHYRTTADILLSGHLFTHNPLVATYGTYPGIEILTAALHLLTGLSIFHAGLVVVGVGRVVLMIALFLLLEQATVSSRVAGMATCLYAANPNFVFFDSAFSYESLAIPLAVLAALLIVRHSTGRERGPGLLLGSLIMVLALVATHHVTAWALAIFLLLLTAFAVAGQARTLRLFAEPGSAQRVAPIAVVCVAAIVAWAAFVAGSDTSTSLQPVADNIFTGLKGLVSGSEAAKHPFQASGVQVETPLEQKVGILSVLLILAVLPFGLWAMRRRGTLWPFQGIIVLATFAYPVSLGLRLTAQGTETSNRASEFLFIAIGLMLATALVLPLRRGNQSWSRARLRTQASAVAFGVFAGFLLIGGVIVGWPPYSRLPGPYVAAAGPRSVDEQAVAAARWMGANVPRQTLITTDSLNGQLMVAYGGVDPQRGSVGGQFVARLFFTPRFGRRERAIVVGDKIRYIVVDRRLSTVRPLQGQYFEGGDPAGFRLNPGMPSAGLSKFARTPGLSLVYDSGPIQIYDAGRLLRGDVG